MKIVCSNLVQLTIKKFENFLHKITDGSVNLIDMEICIQKSRALTGTTIESIKADKCTGCLVCMDTTDIFNISLTGVPTSSTNETQSLGAIAKRYFHGTYLRSQFSNSLEHHAESNETQILNPLSAILVWRLSHSPESTYFSCSPNWELSIYTPDIVTEREGHLDIVVGSPDKMIVIVLEGKRNVIEVLSSQSRDQWTRYADAIDTLAQKNTFSSMFAYVIGGTEVPLYPDKSGAPHDGWRKGFYDYIDIDKKRFISVEALRGLRAYQIAIDNSWSWDVDLAELFDDDTFIGLVSGGSIHYIDNTYVLKKAPWIEI